MTHSLDDECDTWVICGGCREILENFKKKIEKHLIAEIAYSYG